MNYMFIGVWGADSERENNIKASIETDSELRVQDVVLYDGVQVMMHGMCAMAMWSHVTLEWVLWEIYLMTRVLAVLDRVKG